MEIGMALSKVGELGNFIRDQRRTARLSLRKMSQAAGISNPYLSQIERGLRRPSAEILQSIAKALRISSETLYVKAGILEERGDATDPVSALLHDRTITEKQRRVLIEVYQSFRHENDLAAVGPRARGRGPATKQPRARTAPPKRVARPSRAAKRAPAKRRARGTA